MQRKWKIFSFLLHTCVHFLEHLESLKAAALAALSSAPLADFSLGNKTLWRKKKTVGPEVCTETCRDFSDFKSCLDGLQPERPSQDDQHVTEAQKSFLRTEKTKKTKAERQPLMCQPACKGVSWSCEAQCILVVVGFWSCSNFMTKALFDEEQCNIRKPASVSTLKEF